MLCKIDVDSWKPKVERFISARFVVAGIRPIAERDLGSQFAARSFQVKLVPGHCSIRICLRLIWAGDADRIGRDGNARYEKSSEHHRESHFANVRIRNENVQCSPF